MDYSNQNPESQYPRTDADQTAEDRTEAAQATWDKVTKEKQAQVAEEMASMHIAGLLTVEDVIGR